MAASIDLLLPVGADPYAAAERDLVRTAVRDRLAAGLWVRDLPSVPAGDPDVGQGGDPFAHLGVLVGAGLDRGLGPSGTLGTASIILGVRHPLVVARAILRPVPARVVRFWARLSPTFRGRAPARGLA